MIKPKAAVSFILTGLTVTGGRMVRDQEPILTDRIIVGGMVYVLGLAIMNQYSVDFTDVFALLVFIAAFLIYGMDLMRAVGFKLRESE